MFAHRTCAQIGLASVLVITSAANSAAIPATTPQSISLGAIEELKAGHYRKAVVDFFGSSDIVAKKRDGMNNLVDQIETAMVYYGPIHSCELVDNAKRGTMIEVHLYLCQHDQFVSRWRFHMMRTKSGWSGMNFGFDEKVMLPINEPAV